MNSSSSSASDAGIAVDVLEKVPGREDRVRSVELRDLDDEGDSKDSSTGGIDGRWLSRRGRWELEARLLDDRPA